MASIVASLSADDFMKVGLERHHPKWPEYLHGRNVDRFKEMYGVIPETCAAIWDLMRNSLDPAVRLNARKDKPSLFLVSLRFLWTYDTEADLCIFSGIRGKQTVRKWWKHYVRKMERLLDLKVCFVVAYDSVMASSLLTQ